MKIAIHHTRGSFSERWIEYCKVNQIPWYKVDCYKNDIMQQLADCDALLWHFSQNNPKDILFAKQLVFSVEAAGKLVFPNSSTCWHFNDKVGQKYLLEAIGAPLVNSYLFFDKKEAKQWAKEAEFPKIFKLRGGAGSQNVIMVKTRNSAFKLINKAFFHGFPAYDALGSMKERWRKYRLGKANANEILKGIVRFVYPPPYARVMGQEVGYIYFQDFIPDNDHDIRIVVIGNKAFAIKRMVRKNDFRASGSGHIIYDPDQVNNKIVRLSFDLVVKLKSQCVAFDYIFDKTNPLLVEISYGFTPEGYDQCRGYWDSDLKWYQGKFNPYGWMVDNLVNDIK
jgi:glutathione synthase/RimK-type ligase-like ATP-grasp enzyme